MSKKIRLISIYLLFAFIFSIVPGNLPLIAHAETEWHESILASEPKNDGWQRMSEWYENTGNSSTASVVKINYFFPSKEVKQIFSYNDKTKKWESWSSVDDRKSGAVSATVSDATKVALFLRTKSLAFGDASWYRYKGGLFAASPDFPKGTQLKVTNLDNNKSVVVTVNDYGPDRARHPERAIDLDLVAFEKIANKSAGVAKVKVEPVGSVISKGEAEQSVTINKQEIVIKPTVVEKPPVIKNQPKVDAKSAIAVWEDSNETIFSQDINKQLPLASLTKIVAVKVFLDTKTSLDKVVTYKYADEKYNYEYCEPWESARLKVKDGETMTVRDLLYSTLVGSANNAIESLVRSSGLSRPDFIAKMNSTVKAWGAKNTKFVEPSGLSPDNVSSASDYVIITKEALKDINLQKIDTTKTYSFKTINTKISHTLKNTSKLMQTSDYSITASKTGFLNEAGYCLMSRVKIGARNLIVVVFGAKSSLSSSEITKQIINFSTAK